MLKKITQIILLVFVSFFFLGIGDVSAEDLCPAQEFKLGDDNKYIKFTVTYLSAGSNNVTMDEIKKYNAEVSEKDQKNPGGVFLDANDKTSLSKEQAKLNENGEGELVFFAHAVTYRYVMGLDILVSVNGKDLYGGNKIVTGCGNLAEGDGHIKFKLKLESKGYKETDDIVFTLYAPVGLNTWGAIDCRDRLLTSTPEHCNYAKEFSSKVPISVAKAAAAAGDDANAQAEAMEGVEVNTNTTTSVTGIKEWGTTSIGGVGVGVSEKVECDSSLKNFISKYWKYFMVLTPILLMIMITIDFAKALFSSDQELVSKATQSAVKRVIAAVLLLCLPLILELILGFFGIELCI